MSRCERKNFALALCAISFAVAASTEAQQTKKIPRIGYLSSTDPSAVSDRSAPFRQALRELGYVEGENIVIEYRYAEHERQRAHAAELVRLPVDVIFATSTTVARVAKDVSRTTPVVFLSAAEPVSAGLVQNLARPGGDPTGFATIAAVLAGKRLELLQETIPKLSRVAVLWEPKNQGSEESWEESQQAARQLALQIHSLPVSSAHKFESAFSAASNARSDALAVTLSRLFSSNQKLIVSLAAKRRIPAIYTREEFVESGGLMSYGADQDEPFRRIAMMIDKLLKGAKPAELPVEQPTKFDMVINLKTAKQIGLTIPPHVLARADRVIR